jgi:hypothetical protein
VIFPLQDHRTSSARCILNQCCLRYLRNSKPMKTVMKKLYALALLFFTIGAGAQQIDSIVMVPAAPTSTDVITVYTYLSFPQGSCADIGTVYVMGNTVYGYGFHCMGNTMSICNDVDTVTFGPLAAGSYSYISTLDAGYGPPGNCSPGFLPYDRDTVPFTVTLPTDVPEVQAPAVSVYPNPASECVSVSLAGGILLKAELMNWGGEIIAVAQPHADTYEIEVGALPVGMYFCRVRDNDGNVYIRAVEVVR